ALPRPMFEEAMPRRLDAEVAFQLLVDVDEAGRRPDAGLDREAQAMRLAGAVIGVLAEDDDAHRVQRGQVQRPEIFAALREDALALGLFGHEEAFQSLHIGLAELACERLQPAFVKPDALVHVSCPAFAMAAVCETPVPSSTGPRRAFQARAERGERAIGPYQKRKGNDRWLRQWISAERFAIAVVPMELRGRCGAPL